MGGLRAERLLATGNLASHRALLADAGQLADPHRRYHAQLIMLRQGDAFAAAAAALSDHPACSTRSISSSRPFRLSLALACIFIRCPPWD